MLDFIRKPQIWSIWESGLDAEIGKAAVFNIKSMQDAVVYSFLRGMTGKTIAEVGGGNSRVLPKLAAENSCYNLEKFLGTDGGPGKEVNIPGVKNVKVYLGEHSELLAPNSFDVVFSISVVEHIGDNRLSDFVDDGLRVLKSGGLWLHAIDMYLEDQETPAARRRFNAYRGWLAHPQFEPLGETFGGEARFSCDMLSNPDNIMHMWSRVAPQLSGLRQKSQGVSLLTAARKR